MKFVGRVIAIAAVAFGACIIIGLVARSGSRSGPSAAVVAPTTKAPSVSEPTAQPVSTAALAPTEPPSEPTAAPAIGKIGERREAGGVALTVVKVEKAKKIGSFQEAGGGKTYLLTEVIVETTGKDKAPYNPLYFKVKDKDGFEYNATINTADNGLKSGELANGDKARGVVAFEIPEAAHGLVLSYEPIVILGGYEPIRVALD